MIYNLSLQDYEGYVVSTQKFYQQIKHIQA